MLPVRRPISPPYSHLSRMRAAARDPAAQESGGRPIGQDWLDQIFRAKAASTGGVVRRRIADVEREIGRAALELEVRKRGFHMIECGDHIVILCNSAPIRIIC